MIILAYILTLTLAPLISNVVAMIGLTPFLTAGLINENPRFFSTLQGSIIGIVAGWCSELIFHFCNIEFSNTPLWLLGVEFLLWDFIRLQNPSSSAVNIMRVGAMIGTPLGLFIFSNWLR